MMPKVVKMAIVEQPTIRPSTMRSTPLPGAELRCNAAARENDARQHQQRHRDDHQPRRRRLQRVEPFGRIQLPLFGRAENPTFGNLEDLGPDKRDLPDIETVERARWQPCHHQVLGHRPLQDQPNDQEKQARQADDQG